MTADTTDALDIQHAFGRNLGVLPFRDCLWRHAYELSQGSLGSDCVRGSIYRMDCLCGFAHSDRKYTAGLCSVYRWLIAHLALTANNQPMVNTPPTEKRPRPTPAPDPRAYDTFASWLRESVRERGLQRQLANYCEASPQSVTKWLTKSTPGIPALKQIASWARVDVMDLRRLIDGTFDDPQFDAGVVGNSDQWPFRFQRARWEQLLPGQRKDIEEVVERMVRAYEAGSPGPRRKSGSGRRAPKQHRAAG